MPKSNNPFQLSPEETRALINSFKKLIGQDLTEEDSPAIEEAKAKIIKDKGLDPNDMFEGEKEEVEDLAKRMVMAKKTTSPMNVATGMIGGISNVGGKTAQALEREAVDALVKKYPRLGLIGKKTVKASIPAAEIESRLHKLASEGGLKTPKSMEESKAFYNYIKTGNKEALESFKPEATIITEAPTKANIKPSKGSSPFLGIDDLPIETEASESLIERNTASAEKAPISSPEFLKQKSEALQRLKKFQSDKAEALDRLKKNLNATFKESEPVAEPTSIKEYPWDVGMSPDELKEAMKKGATTERVKPAVKEATMTEPSLDEPITKENEFPMEDIKVSEEDYFSDKPKVASLEEIKKRILELKNKGRQE